MFRLIPLYLLSSRPLLVPDGTSSHSDRSSQTSGSGFSRRCPGHGAPSSRTVLHHPYGCSCCARGASFRLRQPGSSRNLCYRKLGIPLRKAREASAPRPLRSGSTDRSRCGVCELSVPPHPPLWRSERTRPLHTGGTRNAGSTQVPLDRSQMPASPSGRSFSVQGNPGHGSPRLPRHSKINFLGHPKDSASFWSIYRPAVFFSVSLSGLT